MSLALPISLDVGFVERGLWLARARSSLSTLFLFLYLSALLCIFPSSISISLAFSVCVCPCQGLLSAAYDLLERDLQLLGLTGIEDCLQEQVCSVIKLSNA